MVSVIATFVDLKIMVNLLSDSEQFYNFDLKIFKTHDILGCNYMVLI